MAEPPLKVVLVLEAQDHATAKIAAVRSELGKLGDVGGPAGKGMEHVGKKQDELASKSEGFGKRVGGVFQKLGSEMGQWGIPFSGVVGEMGKKMEEASSHGTTAFDKLAGVGKVATVGLVAGAAAAGAESIHLAEKYQQSTGQIAAQAEITVAQAKKIGDAFLKTGFQTTFSAQQLADAYAPVSGQLGAVAGHALSANEALSVMRASTDLAESSHTDLGSATATVAKTLQAFQMPLSSATTATNALFVAGSKTGQGVGAVSGELTRLASQLGAVKPSMTDLTAFMVDLTQHGETGRAAIGAVSSAITTLLKAGQESTAQSKGVASAQKAEQTAADEVAKAKQHLADLEAAQAAKHQLSVSQQITLSNAEAAVTKANASGNAAAIAAANQKLQQTEERLQAATGTTIQQQQALVAAQDAVRKAQDKQVTAQQALVTAMNANSGAAAAMGIKVYDAHGQFVGLHSIIAQLAPKLHGLTTEQQLNELQTLFGAQANRKLLDTVLAGPDAFDKLTGAVTTQNAAHDAAEKATANLHGQMEKLKSGVEDLGVQFGEWLIPKLTAVAKVASEVVGWFEKHRLAAEALAAVIAGALGLAVTAFAVQTMGKFVSSIKDALGTVGKLKDAISGKVGGTMSDDATTASQKLSSASATVKSNLQDGGSSLNTAAKNLNEASDNLRSAGQQASGEMESAAGAETGAAGAETGAAGAETAAAGAETGAAGAETGAAGAETAAAGEEMAAAGEEVAAAGAGAATGAAGAADIAAGAELAAGGEALAAGAGGATAAAALAPLVGGALVLKWIHDHGPGAPGGGANLATLPNADPAVVTGQGIPGEQHITEGPSPRSLPTGGVPPPDSMSGGRPAGGSITATGVQVSQSIAALKAEGFGIVSKDQAKAMGWDVSGAPPAQPGQEQDMIVTAPPGSNRLGQWVGEPAGTAAAMSAPSAIAKSLPRFFDVGGLVTKPTLAMLAANSRPEVVLPLDNPARMAEILSQAHAYMPATSAVTASTLTPTPARSGTTITNLNVYCLSQPMDAQEIAREVASQVKKV